LVDQKFPICYNRSIVRNKESKMDAEKTTYSQRHGSPYDRGSADSYYHRDYWPHYFTADTHRSRRIDMDQMTPYEIEAYTAGYYDNEADGNKKEW
jgi:hypothetical protein